MQWHENSTAWSVFSRVITFITTRFRFGWHSVQAWTPLTKTGTVYVSYLIICHKTVYRSLTGLSNSSHLSATGIAFKSQETGIVSHNTLLFLQLLIISTPASCWLYNINFQVILRLNPKTNSLKNVFTYMLPTPVNSSRTVHFKIRIK